MIRSTRPSSLLVIFNVLLASSRCKASPLCRSCHAAHDPCLSGRSQPRAATLSRDHEDNNYSLQPQPALTSARTVGAVMHCLICGQNSFPQCSPSHSSLCPHRITPLPRPRQHRHIGCRAPRHGGLRDRWIYEEKSGKAFKDLPSSFKCPVRVWRSCSLCGRSDCQCVDHHHPAAHGRCAQLRRGGSEPTAGLRATTLRRRWMIAMRNCRPAARGVSPAQFFFFKCYRLPSETGASCVGCQLCPCLP